jgi:hypothetical protein
MQALDAHQYSTDVLARLREHVHRAGVEPGDTFTLDPESVPVARVMRLASECGVSYSDLFSAASTSARIF